MNPTIEIKQGINCRYIQTMGVNVDDVPVGRYRLIDEAEIEELRKKTERICKRNQNGFWENPEQFLQLLTATGMGRKDEA
jgi:hypothetical protein